MLNKFFKKIYNNYLEQYIFFVLLRNIYLFLFFKIKTVIYYIKLPIDNPRLFYRQFLSKYYIWRLVKKLLLKVYFIAPDKFMRLRQLIKNKSKTFKIIHTNPSNNILALSGRILDTGGPLEIEGPKFTGNYPIQLHADKKVLLEQPAIYYKKYKSIDVISGLNGVFKNEFLIIPEVFDLKGEMIPAEIFCNVHFDSSFKTINVPVTKKKIYIDDKVISLIGQCSGNYAHWVTETLPKLAIANECKELDSYSLIVDEWVHPNVLRSIEVLNLKKRKIYSLKRWECYQINELVEISQPSHIPYETRLSSSVEMMAPSPRHFKYSFYALNKLRSAVIQSLNLPSRVPGKKIYLIRNKNNVGNGRLISNIQQAEGILKEAGYEFLDPMTLSFEQQLQVFSEADIVVSPIGAALSNAIFSQPGMKLIILSPYYENANYYFFSNLLTILGHIHTHVLGSQISSLGHIAHRDYVLNLDFLANAIRDEGIV